MSVRWNIDLERFIDLHPAVREAMMALLDSYSSGSQSDIDNALTR